MHIITLTTDFGTRDWFVGTMKGVILGVNPRASVVDITHEIPAGDIRAAAYALGACHRFFPRGAVHLVVVDPGVGSPRKAIVVQTAHSFFIGPDNGVLSLALARERIKSIREITNERFFVKPVSRTFHGRDIFAPVAAMLSRGHSMRNLGPVQSDFLRLTWPIPRVSGENIEGEVIYVDRFGNAITNMASEHPQSLGKGPRGVYVGRKRLCPVGDFYQSVPPGRPVAVVGSSGYLEIAVNGGSASKKLRLRVGSRLTVRR